MPRLSLELDASKAKIGARAFEAATKQVQRAVSSVGRAMGAATNAARNFLEAFNPLRLRNLISLLTGAAFVKASIQFIKFSGSLENSRLALQNLAATAGQSSEQIVSAMQRAAQGTLSQAAAIQSANRTMILGVAKTAGEFSRLTELATVLGRAMGITTTQAINDLTLGIGRISRFLLDNLGIVISAENAYKRYAQAIGKRAQDLTDAEKRQAFLNQVLSQAGEIMERIGKVSTSSAVAFQRFFAAASDLAAEVAKGLDPAFASFADILTDIVQNVGPSFLEFIADAVDKLARLAWLVEIFAPGRTKGQIAGRLLAEPFRSAPGQAAARSLRDSARNLRLSGIQSRFRPPAPPAPLPPNFRPPTPTSTVPLQDPARVAAFAQGLFNDGGGFRGVGGPDRTIAAELAEDTRDVTRAAIDAREAADRLGQAFGDTFGDALIQARSLQDALLGIGQAVLRVLVQEFVGRPIGLGVASLAGSFFRGIGLPSVARSQHGNIFSSPSVTSIAETGRPEAVLPLERDAAGMLGVRTIGGGGGVTVQRGGSLVTVVANDAGSRQTRRQAAAAVMRAIGR